MVTAISLLTGAFVVITVGSSSPAGRRRRYL